jgi:hypothetical protein
LRKLQAPGGAFKAIFQTENVALRVERDADALDFSCVKMYAVWGYREFLADVAFE